MFGQIGPAGVTGLRLWWAALIITVLAGRGVGRIVRQAISDRAWRDLCVAVAFGVVLGVMNYSIYQSFARIPLGVAVTIEFLGPLAVAVNGYVAEVVYLLGALGFWPVAISLLDIRQGKRIFGFLGTAEALAEMFAGLRGLGIPGDRSFGGKGQHVRGRVDAPPVTVEQAYSRIIGQDDSKLVPGC